MISKIVTLTALLASTIAQPVDHHDATSFAHFNDNHNSVHHIQSAPQAYHHKPAPQQYQHVSQPQVYQVQAPQLYHAQQPQVYRAQQPQVYHAQQPQVYHVQQPQVYQATPVKVAAPVYQQAYSAPSYPKAYAAPAAKLALPAFTVAKAVAPVAHYSQAPAHYQEEKYPDAHPRYEFAYLIEDKHTGDYHSQQEQRDGDHVAGQYSLHEADGTIRIVKYFDEGHGFNAVVERQGHPTEAPQQYKKVVVPVAKVAVPAPQYEHHY